jgi:hypothetical protein
MTSTLRPSRRVEQRSGTTEHADEKRVRSYERDLTLKVVRDGTRAGASALHEPWRGMWSASEASVPCSMI